MNDTQKLLVRASFEKVLPIANAAAALFYRRLFELDPSLKPLFKGDMREQGRKLMSAIQLVVAGLDRLDKIVPAVQHLGRRHAGYGVKPEHYRTVGAALLWTLEQGLGEAFTPETKDAWIAAYTLLSDTMIAAAEDEVVSIAAPATVAMAPTA
ncbi:MAG TPA: globin family protein [Anaerolineae bacterium]|nr:globin family protein [Anaerolineae bacterium]